MIMACMKYKNKFKVAHIRCIDCECKAESAKIICEVKRRSRPKNHHRSSKKFSISYDNGRSKYTVNRKKECNDSLRVVFIPREVISKPATLLPIAKVRARKKHKFTKAKQNRSFSTVDSSGDLKSNLQFTTKHPDSQYSPTSFHSVVKQISSSTSSPVEYVAPTVVFILSIIGSVYFLLRRREKSRARKRKLRTRYLREEKSSGIPTSSTACVESEYSTIDDALREPHVRNHISSKSSMTVGERPQGHKLSPESRACPDTTYFSLEPFQDRNREIGRESNEEKRQLKDEKFLSQSVDSRISRTDYSKIDQLERLEIETLEGDGLNDYFVLESVQKQNNQGIMKVCKDGMCSDDHVHTSNGWIEDEFSQNKDILNRTKGPMFQITKQSSEQQDTATYSHITSEHGDYNHLCH